MSPEELADYAATVILEHARNIDLLSIHELAEQHLDAGEISDEDAKTVADLITKSDITVSFPGGAA